MKIKEIKAKAEAIAKSNEGSVKELAELVSVLADKVVEVANQDPGVARRAHIEHKTADL